MAGQQSFDVSTGADLQEVDNALNQARQEVRQRYDFKGSKCVIEFDRVKAVITLEADDEFRMTALWDVIQNKMIRRKVPLQNVTSGEDEPASGGRVRRHVTLTQGLPTDTARAIVRDIKAQGLKKTQAAIQGDEVRVTSPSRDTLQEVIAFLEGQDYGVALNFGNYRG